MYLQIAVQSWYRYRVYRHYAVYVFGLKRRERGKALLVRARLRMIRVDCRYIFTV